MSLSEAPTIKINYDTAQNVSDEILGGAIKFCREAGYKQNAMMLTFIWSAFLFTSKKALDECGILKDTSDCFVRALGKVWPKVEEDPVARESVGNLQLHYWEQLSTDFAFLDTSDEILLLIKIADELNTKGNADTTTRTTNDYVKIFARISSNINSSIYCILRNIDSELGIRYKYVLDEFRYARFFSEIKAEKNKKLQKTPVTKYCSKCGSKIDNETKICSGCGKQHFRGFKITKSSLTIAVLSLLLITSLVFNIIQLNKINEIDTQREFSINQVDYLLSEISELENAVSENQNIANFVDRFVVFVEDDGTNYYHKFECNRFVANSFWVYNTEAAIANKLTPCPYCH